MAGELHHPLILEALARYVAEAEPRWTLWCAASRDDATRLLAAHPDCDAVFFCNDDLAQGALMAALRLGIAVPQRVAVAGFNDLTGSDQMLPALTTVRTPRAVVGSEAAAMLLALMRGERVSPSSLDLGFELVVRLST